MYNGIYQVLEAIVSTDDGFLIVVLMKKRKASVWNWAPALLMMTIIFCFSAQPSVELPNFDWADRLVKKSGHVLGYAVLALSYWFALGLESKRHWLAWVLTIIYAMTDEYHQSFVLGRHASAWDVVIFDNIGALVALWWAGQYLKQRRPSDAT